MAKYTTTIKTLLKNNFDLGLKNYPIFDENYREILNNKIIMHYYEDEIGMETAELFKFYLNNKMNEIMPYYNNLYNAEKEVVNDLFNTINFEEVYNSQSNATTNNNISNETTNNSNITNNSNMDIAHHNTPQGIVNEQKIKDSKYLSSLDKNESNNTSTEKTTTNDKSTSNNTSNNNQNYTRKIKGLQGKTKIEVFNEIKNNLSNIDMMIINDLEELFFGIF